MGQVCVHLQVEHQFRSIALNNHHFESSCGQASDRRDEEVEDLLDIKLGKDVIPAVGDHAQDVHSETSTALHDDSQEFSLPFPANSFESVYGHPATPEIVVTMLPPGGGGLEWQALLVDHAWYDPNECLEDREIKPRRRLLPVRISDFVASLVNTNDHRYIFSGVLNGWPGLTCLELVSIAKPIKGRSQSTMRICWEANSESGGDPPPVPSDFTKAELTLRMPSWTSHGWNRDNPGRVWWYFAQRPMGPMLAWGRNMGQVLLQDLERFGNPLPKAAAAHLFVHRYAVGDRSETRADLATYHSAVLLEWDCGLCATVVELGPMGGIAARQARSDWYDDKLDDYTALSRQMPACMVMPWRDDLAEIRCSDVQARNLDEFKSYVARYTGHQHRFVDPRFSFSGPVRLNKRSQLDVMEYLYSYMAHERRFDIKYRSCQTFACDFFSLLTGQTESVKPFNPVLAKAYQPHRDWFLYMPGGDHPPFLDAENTRLGVAGPPSLDSTFTRKQSV